MMPEKLSKLTPEQLKQALPDGCAYSGSTDGRFVHTKDSNGNYRIRIEPADKVTKYPHIHILDGDGINDNIVLSNGPNGHMPR
ncbi:hypothetical protein [Clostridium sp. UBA6640]|uniref:hypothetical protein n=1 Tax=Clostridium sp. UBA6640 TaxID=1946370 RepID=UPI0025B81EE0|nr:hypothetical protein [Clostridium sp. UBA6640]